MALEQSLGIVSTAAKAAGISRDTHYHWYNTDENYKNEVESLSDIALDYAESHLFKAIGNGNITAVIFYLKTKGRSRGYIERINEIEKSDPSSIHNMTDDELNAELIRIDQLTQKNSANQKRQGNKRGSSKKA